METKDKRLYERPAMTVVELQHRSAVLLQTSGDPKYNGFKAEEEW